MSDADTAVKNWPDGRRKHGQKASRTLIPGAFVFLLLLAIPPYGGWAQEEDEDEVNLRGDVPTVPEDVAKEKRIEARKEGASYIAEGWVFSGVDTNIFRSPHGLEQSGAFIDMGGQARADFRFSDGGRLLPALRLETTRYPGHASADVGKLRMAGSYTRPMTENTAIDLDIRVRYKSDDATNIFGDHFTRNFAYWEYEAEAEYLWHVTEAHRFGIGGDFVFRDYYETSELNSLDWQEPGFIASYKRRFGRERYLGVEYSLLRQEFKQEPASFEDGRELPTNPDEKHRWQKVRVRYSSPFGKKWDFEAGYTFKQKKDLFQDFESYIDNGIDADICWFPTEKTRLELIAEYSIRDFNKRLADGDEQLDWNKWIVTLTASQRLKDFASLYGTAGYYIRDTNRTEGSSFRDYEGVILSVGINVFF
jgi:hypothetical protein